MITDLHKIYRVVFQIRQNVFCATEV